jgi:hypothetical protein
MPMLGLIVVNDETGVNDAGHPAEQSQQDAQDETQNPACHQDSDRWENDAKKVAERFQFLWFAVLPGNFDATPASRNHRLSASLLIRIARKNRLLANPSASLFKCVSYAQ